MGAISGEAHKPVTSPKPEDEEISLRTLSPEKKEKIVQYLISTFMRVISQRKHSHSKNRVQTHRATIRVVSFWVNEFAVMM